MFDLVNKDDKKAVKNSESISGGIPKLEELDMKAGVTYTFND
jgi:hypothetical protein